MQVCNYCASNIAFIIQIYLFFFFKKKKKELVVFPILYYSVGNYAKSLLLMFLQIKITFQRKIIPIEYQEKHNL
jgi:hypothetical protein